MHFCFWCIWVASTLICAEPAALSPSTPKVHARSGEPYRWTRERYEISRNMLLRTGFIEQAEPFRMTESGPRPARYRLTMKGLEPVELRRAKKQLTLAPPGNVLPI